VNALLALATALAYIAAGLIFAVVCVIMVPILVIHIVYTNWKEHTL
jgi:hypothetical protein